MNVQPVPCAVCGHTASPSETAQVRGNTRALRERKFFVWRCAACRSLHGEKVSDLAALYQNYPIRSQKLKYFTRVWYGVILRRLAKAGLRRDHTLLDYGCNSGLFLDYLRERGYANCVGYDPYAEQFRSTGVLETSYDAVVSIDVIEHDETPQNFLGRLAALVKPGGLLCIGCPNAHGIALSQGEAYLHALHMPYHLHIPSQNGLSEMAKRHQLTTRAVYTRWYKDHWLPATSRHLVEKLLMYGGNDLDLAYEPPRLRQFFKHPSLFVYLFLGYFLPPNKTDHMMMIFSPSSVSA